MSASFSTRRNARDEHWATRTRLAIAWAHGLPVDEPSLTGTTNAAQIMAMRARGKILGSLMPRITYGIIMSSHSARDAPGFFYEGCDYSPWLRTDQAGMVVGPFAYASYEAAERAQRLRAS
jgi:hypothetical protein